jgi:hypothetical protein
VSFRAIWIDAGNDADYAKLARYGIDRPYFDIRDPRVTQQYLLEVHARGFKPGVYAAWNWPEAGKTGPSFASWLSAALEAVAPSSASTFPTVCVDIELHSPAYVLAFLKRWRELRPARVTDWTLEGFQGGLFSPLDTLAIARANVRIIAQLYTGSMAPLAADRVALDLVLHSFPPARIFGFYDAATLTPEPGAEPSRWEGYAFTQGRLP